MYYWQLNKPPLPENGKVTEIWLLPQSNISTKHILFYMITFIGREPVTSMQTELSLFSWTADMFVWCTLWNATNNFLEAIAELQMTNVSPIYVAYKSTLEMMLHSYPRFRLPIITDPRMTPQPIHTSVSVVVFNIRKLCRPRAHGNFYLGLVIVIPTQIAVSVNWWQTKPTLPTSRKSRNIDAKTRDSTLSYYRTCGLFDVWSGSSWIGENAIKKMCLLIRRYVGSAEELREKSDPHLLNMPVVEHVKCKDQSSSTVSRWKYQPRNFSNNHTGNWIITFPFGSVSCSCRCFVPNLISVCKRDLNNVSP